MHKGLLIFLIILGVILIAGLTVLFFFLNGHRRIRKQIREMTRVYDYIHALLFGQHSQWISKLENISRTNLLYVQTYETFVRRYKEIRNVNDATTTATINKLKDLLAEKKYKQLKVEIPPAKIIVDEFESKALLFNNELLDIIRPEEECHEVALGIKDRLRNLKNSYYAKSSELSLIGNSYETIFANIDKSFDKFEQYVESAHYNEAQEMLPKIDNIVTYLEKAFAVLPDICITVQRIIPDKIVSLKDSYDEMTSLGYHLHHIVKPVDIEGMELELQDLTELIRKMNLNGVQSRLSDLRNKIDGFMDSFEKEKVSKAHFDNECKNVYNEEALMEKKFIKIYNGLPKIKSIYILPPEQQEKIDKIRGQLNNVGATKRSLDTLIHSNDQPYSILEERMNKLKEESQNCQNSLEDFRRYLFSLKSDSEEAANAIKEYYEKALSAESLVYEMDIEAVYNRYNAALEEIFSLIDDANKILRNSPIDVEALNEKVTSFKWKGDEVTHNIRRDYQQMLLSEAAIVYANRERNKFGEVDTLLLQTEGLYFSGDFSRSYEETLKELKRRNSEN